MTFPLFALLIIYAIFLFICLVFSLVGVYHMVRFGLKNFTTFLATFVYMAVLALILFISYDLLKDIDWSFYISIL